MFRNNYRRHGIFGRAATVTAPKAPRPVDASCVVVARLCRTHVSMAYDGSGRGARAGANPRVCAVVGWITFEELDLLVLAVAAGGYVESRVAQNCCEVLARGSVEMSANTIGLKPRRSAVCVRFTFAALINGCWTVPQ